MDFVSFKLDLLIIRIDMIDMHQTGGFPLSETSIESHFPANMALSLLSKRQTDDARHPMAPTAPIGALIVATFNRLLDLRQRGSLGAPVEDWE